MTPCMFYSHPSKNPVDGDFFIYVKIDCEMAQFIFYKGAWRYKNESISNALFITFKKVIDNEL